MARMVHTMAVKISIGSRVNTLVVILSELDFVDQSPYAFEKARRSADLNEMDFPIAQLSVYLA